MGDVDARLAPREHACAPATRRCTRTNADPHDTARSTTNAALIIGDGWQIADAGVFTFQRYKYQYQHAYILYFTEGALPSLEDPIGPTLPGYTQSSKVQVVTHFVRILK